MQKNTDGTFIDPKKIDPNLFKDIKVEDFIILQPQTVVLAKTVEYFRIPRDIITIAFGNRETKVKVLNVQESIRKEDAENMYEYVS